MIRGRSLAWFPIVLFALGVRPTAAPAPSADVLIMIDLSPSLARQRDRIADIAGAILRQEVPSGAPFAIYAMESSLGDASPLLSGRIPAPVTSRETVEARAQLVRWEAALHGAIASVLNGKERQRQFTSCYVKSAGFASDYFKARVASRRVVIWIGDLIEDCREPRFTQFRLARVRAGALPGTAGHPLPSLSSVEIVAAIVPRAPGEPAREVDASAVTVYWNGLAGRLGVSPNQLRIGTPDLLGLTVAPQTRSRQSRN